MKSDIDNLMQKYNLDAILVVGPGQYNPAMVYLTGGAHLTDAYLIKKRGDIATLFHRAMERDEAQKTGLETRTIESYSFPKKSTETERDHQQSLVALVQLMLNDLNINSGRLALYGLYDAGHAYGIFSSLQSEMPNLTLVGEMEDSLLSTAMATKDQAETARIRKMGSITTDVVAETADYLTNCSVKNEILIKPDGKPLTIGDMRRRINLWLTERNAENPNGIIMAIGHDAGVPHSIGNDNDYFQLGKTIVFDIFPCEVGGGYYYDFTRTWCLGYASDEVYRIYEDVHSVFNQVTNALISTTPFKNYQNLTCDLFEEKGHTTIRQDPRTQSGYVHNIGHGLGLHIHESPSSRLTSSDCDRLFPGTVFTIEPGLYYPEREIGVRLEDTFHVKTDGQIETLAEYSLDLVLPVK